LDDCLTQGKYTQVIKYTGQPSILTLKSALSTVAWATTALAAGVIIDNENLGPQFLMKGAIPWAVLALVPVALNFLGDEKDPNFCKIDFDLAKKNKKIFFLATVLGFTTFVNVGFGLTAGSYALTRLFVSNALMCSVLGVAFFCIDKRIAKINVYLYACRLCTFGLSYPLQNFYTTDPEKCPRTADGELINLPGFPFTVYTTMGGLAGNVATLLGLYLFENYLVYWNAQRAFWVTTAFQLVAGMFDIMNTSRFNQTILGWVGLTSQTITISDRVLKWNDLCTFLFGSAFLEPLIDQLDALPSTLLLSKLCPKGVETTMFAILAGFSNVGLSLSGQMGSVAAGLAGINFGKNEESPTGYECNLGWGKGLEAAGFNGYTATLLVGNIILPFFTITLTWCFIPDIRLCDDFLDENDDVDPQAGPKVPALQSRTKSGLTVQAEANFIEARSSILSGPGATSMIL